MVPLLVWVARHQSELLANPDLRERIAFDAELLANDKVDLEIKLPLTERVGVHPRRTAAARWSTTPSPRLEAPYPAGALGRVPQRRMDRRLGRARGLPWTSCSSWRNGPRRCWRSCSQADALARTIGTTCAAQSTAHPRTSSIPTAPHSRRASDRRRDRSSVAPTDVRGTRPGQDLKIEATEQSARRLSAAWRASPGCTRTACAIA